jgi:hypothetical protein
MKNVEKIYKNSKETKISALAKNIKKLSRFTLPYSFFIQKPQ